MKGDPLRRPELPLVGEVVYSAAYLSLGYFLLLS